MDAIAVEPDGRNINRDCGSTHVEPLAERSSAATTSGSPSTATATACSPSTATATVVDGDELLALAALHLREHDRLPGNGVAVTVMTNYGFHQSMREHGVEVATTPVGDRNVLAELLERGWALGGEQSGHIIDAGFVPAGDGTAAALLVLEALAGGDLAERHAMEKLPQRLLNVTVADRNALEGADEVWEAVEVASTRLEGRGRVLVRSSGTEPLIRIMVEAPGGNRSARRSCSRWRKPSSRAYAEVGHVRNHWIRRAARVPRPSARGAEASRVPRLRLGRRVAAR